MMPMSIFDSGLNPKYLEAIKKFRLIDDTFFNICFDSSIECMQLLLCILFNRTDIIVQEVWQYGIAFCGKKCQIEAAGE